MSQGLKEAKPKPLEESPQRDDSTGEARQAAPEPRRVPHELWTITEELAGDRNRMASERTLMSWIRTSLAMISFGFGLAKFFDYLQEIHPDMASRLGKGPKYIGEFLLVMGTLLMLGAAIAHWRRLIRIDRGEVTYRSRFSLALLVAFVLFALGVFAITIHFFRI